MSHRMTPRSRRHRNGADPFFEAFVAKLGLDPDLGEALGYRAKGELFAYIAKHIIPAGLEAAGFADEAREFRRLSRSVVSPEGHDRLQNLITDTTTAISKKAWGEADNDRYGARRAKAVTEYYNPNRGFPQSFEVTHREFADRELGDAEAAMDNALSALWYASSSDVFALGAVEGDLLAEAVISVIKVLTYTYGPDAGVAFDDVVMRTVSNALIWLQNIGNSGDRSLPKDLYRLEMPNKGRLAHAQQYGRRVSNPRHYGPRGRYGR